MPDTFRPNFAALQGLAVQLARRNGPGFRLPSSREGRISGEPFEVEALPEGLPPLARAPLGAPIWDQVVLRWPDVPGLGITAGEYVFPPTTVVSYDYGKKIVETEITDGDGYVNQGIHRGRKELKLQGWLFGNANNVRPRDQRIALDRVVSLRVLMEVESEYLNDLGITHLILKKMSSGQTRGSRQVESFSISAHSATPLTLKLRRTA